ncbi:hypothetical protein GCM10027030_30280 [Luteococcus sediminum]
MNEWPWEGAVQQVFVDVLTAEGWVIERAANTATREHGVDVKAVKGVRRLGAEVKGYPSPGYQSSNKPGLKKPSTVKNQALTAYARALLAALKLRDAEPDRESLVVLPEHAQYQQLFEATRQSLAAAQVHVVLLGPDGTITCPTWRP